MLNCLSADRSSHFNVKTKARIKWSGAGDLNINV